MAVDIVIAKLIFNQQVVKRPKNQIYEIIFSNDCLSVFARKRQSKMFLRRRQEKQRSLVNLLQFLQARTIPFSKIIEHQQRYDIGLRTSTEVGFYGLAQIVLTCTNSQFFGTVGALQKNSTRH